MSEGRTVGLSYASMWRIGDTSYIARTSSGCGSQRQRRLPSSHPSASTKHQSMMSVVNTIEPKGERVGG